MDLEQQVKSATKTLPASEVLAAAAQMNNKASEFIQLGRYNEAIEILSQAMITIKKANDVPAPMYYCLSSNYNQEEEEEQRYQEQQQHHYPSRPSLEFVASRNQRQPQAISSSHHQTSSSMMTTSYHNPPKLRMTISSEISSMLSDQQQQQQQQQHPFSSWHLYQDSIKINPTQALLFSKGNKATSMITYAIVYNMALCHHLEVTESSSLSSSYNEKIDQQQQQQAGVVKLERAAVLYTYAQHQLHTFNNNDDNDDDDEMNDDDDDDDDDDDNNDDIMIHSLSITNNLTHVYHCLKDQDAAKRCSIRLLNAMMYLTLDITHSNNEGDNDGDVDDDDDDDNNNSNNNTASTNYHQYVMNKHEFCLKRIFLMNVMTILSPISSLPAAAA